MSLILDQTSKVVPEIYLQQFSITARKILTYQKNCLLAVSIHRYVEITCPAESWHPNNHPHTSAIRVPDKLPYVNCMIKMYYIICSSYIIFPLYLCISGSTNKY